MLAFLKKYLSNRDGAIAVETAIVAPLMILILLPSIDIGLQIQTLQKMDKATDSGVEYVVNGGRNETTLRNIVQESFGHTIQSSQLTIEAYCGCIVSNIPGQNGDDENSDPYSGFYIKTPTQFVEDMCPALCENGDTPSELVDVSLTHSVRGSLGEKQIRTHLQTRIR